jgi:hypothetical protein
MVASSTWCFGGTGILSARPGNASAADGIFSFLSNISVFLQA